VRQTIGHGALFPVGAGPLPEYDQFSVAATNRSLQSAVFLRELGITATDPAGNEVRFSSSFFSKPVRLERNQDHTWEMPFTLLAAMNIDLKLGIRGYAVIAGRDKSFRSRNVIARSIGNRKIPLPTLETTQLR
jgi:hypothetical protein